MQPVVIPVDNIDMPKYYVGENGLEAIEVVKQFAFKLPGALAFFWGNTIKYLLRFQHKNGLEDLKKARKHLDWLIEEVEKNV
ncbi:DUF3310 domain-containing protein [Aerococcaceae bacterium NML191219]|nr:DUF3310 domain-containing protein [Aerococcaceae bacterium NML191219]